MELTPLPIRVAGLGAVSPAGWGVAALVTAVRLGAAIPPEDGIRAPGAPRQRVRRVPRPPAPPAWAREPRLRRTSPISTFVVGAALEALGPVRSAQIKSGELRVGVIVTMLNGCVAFSRRFYAEVLDNPATASPLIFPETVFNAPSSHLAALLGTGEVNYTLVGDTAQFPAALDLAALWIEAGEADGVLVVAAEEADWLSGEASALFEPGGIVAEGAGALYVEAADAPAVVVQRAVPVGPSHPRRVAASRVREAWRAALGPHERETLLCDGRSGMCRADAPETEAFSDWAGPQLSPATVLGDGLGTRAAWQCVLAAEAVAAGTTRRSLVSAIGINQQALGVAFSRAGAPILP